MSSSVRSAASSGPHHKMSAELTDHRLRKFSAPRVLNALHHPRLGCSRFHRGIGGRRGRAHHVRGVDHDLAGQVTRQGATTSEIDPPGTATTTSARVTATAGKSAVTSESSSANQRHHPGCVWVPHPKVTVWPAPTQAGHPGRRPRCQPRSPRASTYGSPRQQRIHSRVPQGRYVGPSWLRTRASRRSPPVRLRRQGQPDRTPWSRGEEGPGPPGPYHGG